MGFHRTHTAETLQLALFMLAVTQVQSAPLDLSVHTVVLVAVVAITEEEEPTSTAPAVDHPLLVRRLQQHLLPPGLEPWLQITRILVMPLGLAMGDPSARRVATAE